MLYASSQLIIVLMHPGSMVGNVGSVWADLTQAGLIQPVEDRLQEIGA